MSFHLDIVRLTLKVLELNIGHEGIVEAFQKTGKLEQNSSIQEENLDLS